MKPLLSLTLLFLLAPLAFGQKLTVTGGKTDATNIVVAVPKEARGNKAITSDGQRGGFIQPNEGDGRLFVLPSLKADEKLDFEFVSVKREPPVLFQFRETAGESVDVLYGEKPVLRYVNKPRDVSNHYLTFKPFHQMFDPTHGKELLSSGAHPNTKEFQFPHHRGLFFGFNKISYGEKQQADIWHGTKNVFSTHDALKETQKGEIFARHAANISWHGEDGKTFANELRTITVYHVEGGTMLDWSTELRTELPKVRLDGDPQHAGFHFRATQEVSINGKENTYYLRPDGKGKIGETRNWDAKGKDPKAVNLPWNAMSFVTAGKRYTVVRINHPDNPKDARGSERDYGRFGDYFEFDLTPKTPLKLNYRLWLQEGDMTVEQCAAMAAGFAQTFEVKFAH
jgi:Methane oxygenase PmoA